MRASAHPRQAYDLAVTLTGREAPFAALEACVRTLCDGRGGIALVMGEKCMGKSLLVERVRQHFARLAASCTDTAVEAGERSLPAVTWLHGVCRSYNQATPYALWLELLQNWLEMANGVSDHDLAGLLRQQAEELWGDQAERYYPYLATLLSLPVKEETAGRVASLRAEGLQKQLSQAIYA